jgi:hypothetical protein
VSHQEDRARCNLSRRNLAGPCPRGVAWPILAMSRPRRSHDTVIQQSDEASLAVGGTDPLPKVPSAAVIAASKSLPLSWLQLYALGSC